MLPLTDAPAVLLAFATCVCMLPFLAGIAAHWRLYDQPGELKPHGRPVPRIGGVAMMVGVMAGVLPLALPNWDRYGLLLLAVVAVWVVGLGDDLKSLPVALRLGLQCLAAAMFWVAGWRLRWSSNVSVDLVLTTLFVVFLINAMNWLDGMDGLAAGTTAIAAAGFLWVSSDHFSRVVAWAIVGVCLGMLLANFPPARMFIGDSGSMLLGALLAFLCLDWVRQGDPADHNIVTPLLFLAVPISDALAAIVRRLRSGRSPFRGDRGHFYDLLADRGWSAYRVLLAATAPAGGFVVLGRMSQEAESRQAAVLLAAGVVLFVAHLLGSLRPSGVQPVIRKSAAQPILSESEHTFLNRGSQWPQT